MGKGDAAGWSRDRRTTITLSRPVASYLHVEVLHETGVRGWRMSLIDYDGACGATATFRTETDALASFDEFVPLARLAYEQKHAKYGRMPVIFRGRDGAPHVRIEPMG